MFAQLDVQLCPLLRGQFRIQGVQQRIQLEADVPVVALGRFPRRQENLLGLADEQVRQLPGDALVVQGLLNEFRDLSVKATRLDEVADDDRVGGRSSRAPLAILGHRIGVHRIQPQLGTGGDE